MERYFEEERRGKFMTAGCRAIYFLIRRLTNADSSGGLGGRGDYACNETRLYYCARARENASKGLNYLEAARSA